MYRPSVQQFKKNVQAQQFGAYYAQNQFQRVSSVFFFGECIFAIER